MALRPATSVSRMRKEGRDFATSLIPTPAFSRTASAFGPCSASSDVPSLASSKPTLPFVRSRKCPAILSRFDALQTTSTRSFVKR